MFHKPINLLSILVLLITTTLGNVFTPVQYVQAQELTPIAIGAIAGSGRHLVAPQTGVVRAALMDEGLVNADSSQETIQSAEQNYYQDFVKQTRTWASPETQVSAEQRANDLSLGNVGVQSDPPIIPVTTSLLVLPVQFSNAVGEEVTYSYKDNTNTCIPASAMGKNGPLQGGIAEPPSGDNHTLYYTPAQTAAPSFYNNLIFGTTGIGRVRTDLKDPIDDQDGINLTGYTVQDYYDHVAGTGNVTLQGSVQGWLTVDHSEAYYGAPSCTDKGMVHDGGNIVDSQNVSLGQLVVDTVAKFNALNPGFDWTQYDLNHDGTVDSFWLIHAGEGEETGGGSQGEFAIWSQSSSLTEDKIGKILVFSGATEADNIYIDPYTILPENVSLGMMTAELGHTVFGLPDLTPADHDNSIAFWSNMANGSEGGYLEGSVPVGMSLYLKSIARCGTDFCNWQSPMNIVDYQETIGSYQISQLEQQVDTPVGSKGIRIGLPHAVQSIDNLASPTDGKGAWSGKNVNNATTTLDYTFTVPSSGAGEISVDSYWSIEACWSSLGLCDFGEVMVRENGTTDWIYLDDNGDVFDTSKIHPILRGSGQAALTFDLSAYKNKTVNLRFSYTTDSAYTEIGWFLDNLKVNGTLLSNFEDFDTAFTHNPGWQAVPDVKEYERYYLVEWRNATKYDQMVRTAYVTNKKGGANGWVVDRIPYNIPGAVISYYDGQAPDNNENLDNDAFRSSPSVGPKSKLLVVDINPEPVRYEISNNYFTLNTIVGSYDAALTTEGTESFNINGYQDGSTTYPGLKTYAAKPAVGSFNDAKGYYAGYFKKDGLYIGSNPWGSAVIPARGDYSIRITDYNNQPLPELYGTNIGLGFPLGDGNPGSNNGQYGVNINLTSTGPNGTYGVIQLSNYSVDYAFSQHLFASPGKFGLSTTVTITNSGSETTKPMSIAWEKSPAFILEKLQNGVTEISNPTSPYSMGTLNAGNSITLTFKGYIAPSSLPDPDLWIKFTPNDGQLNRGPWTIRTSLFKMAIPLVLR